MRYKLMAACLLVIFLPLGIYTLRQAYQIKDSPHVFVMYIFSGTLMILLGLTGLLGLLPARDRTKAQPVDEAGSEGGLGERLVEGVGSKGRLDGLLEQAEEEAEERDEALARALAAETAGEVPGIGQGESPGPGQKTPAGPRQA
ncbi:MAG: hypothetical protein LBU69_06695 [Deltaproteobacteria bacterium]|jgi:hypothetical protein|nr:hypothetical protein [Deltaproteobacteria bacterium]